MWGGSIDNIQCRDYVREKADSSLAIKLGIGF